MQKLLRITIAFLLMSAPGANAEQNSTERQVRAAGQNAGVVTGRVVNSETAEPLIGANVYIAGTEQGTLTDLDGRYRLRGLSTGEYDIAVEMIGFARKTVTGVHVPGPGIVTLDVSLTPRAIALDEIRVEARLERGSTGALLSERRKVSAVIDAIGADQIGRSPDGDAAAALKRVPGLSVVHGKYAFVRGLGERYGSTTLNGSPLPSPEPDRKAIPLDIVPSSLLESLVTSKTYSPEQSGDNAAGIVQIRTRNFPPARILRLTSSVGYNTVSSMRDGLGYSGGSYDFLGVDDGTRGLPGSLPSEKPVSSGGGTTPEELERIGESFAGAWGPTARSVPVNQKYGIAFGDEVSVGDRPLGFIAALTHSSGFSQRVDGEERVFSAAGAAEPEVDYLGQSTRQEVNSGALLNTSFALAPNHRLTTSVVYSRSTEDESRLLQGYFLDLGSNLRSTRIRFLSQSLFNTQLRGEHRLSSGTGMGLDWRVAYSRVRRYEPNTRENIYRQLQDGRFYWYEFKQSGSVFHQDLAESALSGALDVEIPFRLRSLPSTVTFGASIDERNRDTYTRRFRFVPRGSPGERGYLPPNELFSPENIGPDLFEIQEATFREDNYDASYDTRAGYFKIDTEILPRLRLVTGARVENAGQTVTPRDLFDTPLPPVRGASLETTDVLPALNLTYSVGRDVSLRAAASRTLARPQLRELAPFAFADYAGGYLVFGNPLLERTGIQNFDLRGEWFFRPGSLISVSGFLKTFTDPVESLVVPSTELQKTWINAEEATNYGTEIEFRSTLGMLVPALENLTVNANLTLVHSEVRTGGSARIFEAGTGESSIAVVERNRPLQGQSPYVVNGSLTYFSPGIGLSGTVLYHRFGRRVDAVGGQVLPDVYEEARGQLDMVLEKQVGHGLDVKLAATRLLGDRVIFTQGDGELRDYRQGRTISVSLGWEP